MRRLFLILTLSVACAAPPIQAPSTPPPPVPERPTNTAIIHGQVTNARGNPLGRAALTVHIADPTCRPTGQYVGAIADDNGYYDIRVDAGVGPALDGCVVVEARSGGATGRAQAPVLFTTADDDRRRARVDVAVGRAPALTQGESDRIADLLARSIREPHGNAAGELALYALFGDEAVRVALEQYRSVLGTDVILRRGASGDFQTSRRFHYVLEGNGQVSPVFVHQEELTRIHSLILDYGMRSQAFINAWIRAISSGDAERLARILNPDDVDFPVSRARELIVSYRERVDTGTLRAEFAGVDEARHRIRWRITGSAPGGGTFEETIELQTGDGLIGVVGL